MANIKDLDEIIRQHFGNSKKFVSYTAKSLLGPGENYGSEIFKVNIKVLDEKYEEEIVSVIAKAAPPNQLLANMFNTKETFRREIEIYNTVFPTINAFAEEKGIPHFIDFVPKCFGGRISLNPEAKEADQDAVLILENLIESGYEVVDRHTGFDLGTTKIILEDMAKLHAGVIAHKLAKPDEFETKIRSLLLERAMKDPPSEEIRRIMINSTVNALYQENAKYASKIEDALTQLAEFFANPPQPQEQFGTLIHNDLWVNNIMIQFDNKRKAIKNKMVDFQTVEYSSPVSDLLLFLYTSVELSVLRDNVDNLLSFYHGKLIQTLANLQTDTSPFSYEKLMEEIMTFSKFEFGHILFMIKVANTKKGLVKEKSEMKKTDLPGAQQNLHENYYPRLNFVVDDFVKRGWL
ncbi:Ecdysteroid kinase-like family [Popillia japonica]|uniref:Ecdysteroid kinase-like family n=1 Tax=Popillia japonica TaxID=7064 RepID=A0AAW1MYY4_POPJA